MPGMGVRALAEMLSQMKIRTPVRQRHGRPLSQKSSIAWQARFSYTGRIMHPTHTDTDTGNGAVDQQIALHRDYLLRFARLQLRNDAWAEDAVSETLLAALAKPQAFEARSQLKTWLVGILKHKVIDALRQHCREVSLSNNDDDAGAGADDLMDQAMFKPDGHFAAQPANWGNPEEELGSRQFFAVLEACVSKLPASQARLFLMREWLELSSEDICKELGLTPTNLYVQLHRARLRLRECLELNWFAAR
jgi:RNA polymerase sigma-70 factor (ECF subfamily)